MTRLVVLLAVVAVVLLIADAAKAAEASATNLLAFDDSAEAGGWEQWSPRAEVAPEFSVSTDGALVIEGGGLEYCIGGWQRAVKGISPGQRFVVHADVEGSGMKNPLGALWIRVTWGGKVGGEVAPFCVKISQVSPGVYAFDDVVTAPDGATGATVLLMYRWESAGRAVWRNVSMTLAPEEPPHRVVRVSTIYWRPTVKTTVENNLQNFLRMIDQAAADKPDLVVISEGCLSVWIGLDDLDLLSEELPDGRFYKAFAAKAKEHDCYICYGTYERDGIYVFNTAVIIDPSGNMIAKYRKVTLPIIEDIVGLAPGDDFKVFDTPLGKIGIVICWDTAFPESIRCVALKGAEIVLVPIAGGDVEQIKSAAKESGVYVVTASTGMICMIIDPVGEVLAETGKNIGTGVATAECDLDRQFIRPWSANFTSYMKQLRRPDTYGVIVEPIK